MLGWSRRSFSMYFLLRTFHLVEFSSETQVGKSGVLQSISARIFQLQVKNALCMSARQWLVTALKACPYGDSNSRTALTLAKTNLMQAGIVYYLISGRGKYRPFQFTKDLVYCAPTMCTVLGIQRWYALSSEVKGEEGKTEERVKERAFQHSG